MRSTALLLSIVALFLLRCAPGEPRPGCAVLLGCEFSCDPEPAYRFEILWAAPQVDPADLSSLARIEPPIDGHWILGPYDLVFRPSGPLELGRTYSVTFSAAWFRRFGRVLQGNATQSVKPISCRDARDLRELARGMDELEKCWLVAVGTAPRAEDLPPAHTGPHLDRILARSAASSAFISSASVLLGREGFALSQLRAVRLLRSPIGLSILASLSSSSSSLGTTSERCVESLATMRYEGLANSELLGFWQDMFQMPSMTEAELMELLDGDGLADALAERQSAEERFEASAPPLQRLFGLLYKILPNKFHAFMFDCREHPGRPQRHPFAASWDSLKEAASIRDWPREEIEFVNHWSAAVAKVFGSVERPVPEARTTSIDQSLSTLRARLSEAKLTLDKMQQVTSSSPFEMAIRERRLRQCKVRIQAIDSSTVQKPK